DSGSAQERREIGPVVLVEEVRVIVPDGAGFSSRQGAARRPWLGASFDERIVVGRDTDTGCIPHARKAAHLRIPPRTARAPGAGLLVTDHGEEAAQEGHSHPRRRAGPGEADRQRPSRTAADGLHGPPRPRAAQAPEGGASLAAPAAPGPGEPGLPLGEPPPS